MPKNPLEKSKMPGVAMSRNGNIREAQEIVHGLLPRDHRGMESWITDTWKLLAKLDRKWRRESEQPSGEWEDWKHSRVRDIWYGLVRRVDGFELDKLRAAKELQQRQDEERRMEGAKHEYRQLRDRLARMEAYLSHVDPDFHGENLDAVRGQDGRRGGVDMSRD